MDEVKNESDSQNKLETPAPASKNIKSVHYHPIEMQEASPDDATPTVSVA